MMHMHGKPIFVSPLMIPYNKPNRELRKKDWHNKAGVYARRIQKKWNDRYGTTPVDQIIDIGSAFVMSAASYEKLRSALARKP